MMLKISICDDDARDRELIAGNLRIYAEEHREYGISFDTYSSAFEMLDAFEKKRRPGYCAAGYLHARNAWNRAGAGYSPMQ